MGRPVLGALRKSGGVILALLLALTGCADSSAASTTGTANATATSSSTSSSTALEDAETEEDSGSGEEIEADTEDGTQAEASQDEEADASVEELAATTLNPDGIPICEGLPYKGMDQQFVDYTWLGPHDEEEVNYRSSGTIRYTKYTWYADNGTDDPVIMVKVADGEVASVYKYGLSTSYWRDPETLEYLDYPDLSADGETLVTHTATASLPDPLDYDDPYSYADDAEEYFASQGSEDPWNDAVEYWEQNGP